MKINKYKGYTLLEMMMVIGIMTVVSIGVMQNKVNEAKQMRAAKLGVEIAAIATGLGSYVNFYSGIDPSLDPSESAYSEFSPTDGLEVNGINFLKSSECLNSDTTSKGNVPIGFLPECSLLSNITTPALDQKTSFGNMSFTTTFKRTSSGEDGDPYALTSVTYLTPLIDETRNILKNESALAAMVAGGISINTATQEVTAPHSVFYCVSEKGASALYTNTCTGHKDQIAIVISTDSSSAPYLRTDGGNNMNNRIKFNPNMVDTRKAIENITSLLLTEDDGDTNTLAGGLQIGLNINDPIFKLDSTETSLEKGKLLVKDELGYISVENGWIHAKESIISEKGIEAPVYLPYSDADGETENDSNYKIIIDGDSEMDRVAVRGLYFGSDVTNGRIGGGNANISTVSGNESALGINSDKVIFNDVGNVTTSLEGEVKVNKLNILLADGSYKPLSQLLPRYTFLGAQAFSADASGYTVYKTPYEALGCSAGNLKAIATPQSAYVASSYTTDATYRAVNWAYVAAASGYYKTGTTYQLTSMGTQAAYGNFITRVVNYSGYWKVYSQTTGAANSGNSKRNSFNRGDVVMSVYCYNPVAN